MTAPKCERSRHSWQTPYEIVGGARENPGVWSVGGTRMVYREVCVRCGRYRVTLRAPDGPRREVVSYVPADERSREWVEQQRQEDQGAASVTRCDPDSVSSGLPDSVRM
jgi:hypothetical protein